MVITVRLDARARKLLAGLQDSLGANRSEVIRQALLHLAAARGVDDGTTALERLRPYVGIFRSGKGDLSENAGRRMRRLAAKRHARHSR